MGTIGSKTAIADRPYRVTFQFPGPAIPDGDGGTTATWIDLPPQAYARIVPATGKDLERVAAGTVLSTLSRIVTIPYRPDITTTARLTWIDLAGRAHLANVTGVTPDERSTELELVCVEIVL